MEWRNIDGYEGLYQVSNTGEVRSLDRISTGQRSRKLNGKVLSKTKTSTGYWKVDLCKNGNVSHKKVHRLVATAFIPNPLNKPNINHIDNNPLNNNVENLEWCTQSENVLHAHRIGAIKKKRKHTVLPPHILEEIIKEYVPYDSVHGVLAISRRIKINPSTIYSALRRLEELS